MNTKLTVLALVLAFACSVPLGAHAQTCSSTQVTENFTGTSTNCSWNFINGACLTAGTSASTVSPGQIPACAEAYRRSWSYSRKVRPSAASRVSKGAGVHRAP